MTDTFGHRPTAPAIYQIYPRSFQDTTGSGVGDLAGITQRLDYVASLGVDAIWLSPIYVSPMVDGGYDIIDHSAIDPRFGTLDDFDALVARAHNLGLAVYMDQVLNHTSDQCPWFQDAIAGDAAKADWYLWRDPKPDGSPPNNWLSQFGLPGWHWNHKRRQYYYAQFTASQPSLNLRNPDVQATIARQMKGWRDRGVDGFRFDVVTSFLWDESLKDNPPATPEVQDKVSGENFNPYTYQDHTYDMLPGDGAAYAQNLRKWAGDDAYLFGENTSGNQSVALAMAFSEPGRLNATYITDMPEGRGSPATFADLIARGADFQRLPGWLSSHDQPRHGAGDASDAVLALQMAFLPGPWIIYQGEELGLPQPDLSKHEVTDPLDLRYWPDGPGREGARVPVPWNADDDWFGFTDDCPWLPMRWDRDALRRAWADGGMVDFYRRIIALRRDLNWAEADITDVRLNGDVFDMTITTGDDVRYRGIFTHGAHAPADMPRGDALISADGVAPDAAGWSGGVWRLS
ncbi:alpha-glucosidase [Loktanella sp. DSM 29012]|uniref:alpha-amylase family glycosyl hydrolase n=1 Tax=Loktanella sp. DSM 29012 TaxID=1881056 RepID=UPI0008C9EC2E|nr:alpha-amylase family glycosyl hydrolase [Loktanella sp. DSM 29012]SEQ40249.1 alpha-glucosidase [Loktanella sp. DSM 29012]